MQEKMFCPLKPCLGLSIAYVKDAKWLFAKIFESLKNGIKVRGKPTFLVTCDNTNEPMGQAGVPIGY